MSADEQGGVGGRTAREELARWVIAAARPGAAVRFAAPEWVSEALGDVWVEVAALTYQQALERESVGSWEEYSVTEGGHVVAVTRQYDLWAMAAYDLEHCLRDFSLPAEQADGSVELLRRDEVSEDLARELLAAMPPGLAGWVQGCVDRVNLRDTAGRETLQEAKKKPASG